MGAVVVDADTVQHARLDAAVDDAAEGELRMPVAAEQPASPLVAAHSLESGHHAPFYPRLRLAGRDTEFTQPAIGRLHEPFAGKGVDPARSLDGELQPAMHDGACDTSLGAHPVVVDGPQLALALRRWLLPRQGACLGKLPGGF